MGGAGAVQYQIGLEGAALVIENRCAGTGVGDLAGLGAGVEGVATRSGQVGAQCGQGLA